MARPKRAQQVNLQEAIRAVAWKQIADYGAAALSLRAIARELHITAPAIYNYYPRRDDLVTALVIEAFTSFANALEAARDACPPEDHVAWFRAASLAYRQWAKTYPQRYLLLFGTPIAGYEFGPEAATVGQRSFLVLLDGIGTAYAAGVIRLGPGYAALTQGFQWRAPWPLEGYDPIVLQLALSTWSFLHGLTSLELYGYLAGFIGDQVEEFIRGEIEKFMVTLGIVSTDTEEHT